MKCLIADTMHESLMPMLEDINVTYEYRPDIRRPELIEILKDYDGLIIRSKTKIDAEMMAAAPSLKVVCRAGAGIDNLDVEILEAHNVAIVNAPEGNRNAVGEHCLGLLLALMNNFCKAHDEVRKGTWDREGNRGIELAGRTVGIIGYGNTGMTFARKLSGMECTVLVYDKYKENYGDKYARMSNMDQICDEADVLSLHIPLTAETKFMVNDEFFSRFRKPLFFLNTARGEIVRLSAVLRALEEGKLRGAGLDVLENEKLSTFSPELQTVFQKLIKRNDVLITPHVGGWTYESYVRINEVLTRKLGALLPQIQ